MSVHLQKTPWTAALYLPPESNNYTVLAVADRIFGVRAATTGNAVSPSVVRRVDGMSSVDVDLSNGDEDAMQRQIAIIVHKTVT